MILGTGGKKKVYSTELKFPPTNKAKVRITYQMFIITHCHSLTSFCFFIDYSEMGPLFSGQISGHNL